MNWIPVSQTMPYNSGETLVTYQFGHNVYLVDIMIYDKRKKTFTWSQAYQRNMTENVVAWMPLPKPYKE